MDIAGSQAHETFRENSMAKAQMMSKICDMSLHEILEQIDLWTAQIQNNKPEGKHDEENQVAGTGVQTPLYPTSAGVQALNSRLERPSRTRSPHTTTIDHAALQAFYIPSLSSAMNDEPFPKASGDTSASLSRPVTPDSAGGCSLV